MVLRDLSWSSVSVSRWLVVHRTPAAKKESVSHVAISLSICACLIGRGVVYSLKQQDVRLRLVYLVVLPPQALRDAQASPLVFPQQLERASGAVEVVLGDRLEHLLGELHVAVFVVVVIVPVRVGR